MIGLDVDKSQMDRSDMNILGDSVYAIQENYDEMNSIDSGNAQVHNSGASGDESPDQFKSMIGGIHGDMLDPRMTYDLGALKQKKDSFIQNPNDISSILPSSNNNSSFNISLLAGSKNDIKNMRISEALPKMSNFHTLGLFQIKKL